jgi:UDP-N-acetylglucosamine 2-epimerase
MKVLVFAGTRPEAIKMAPVVRALKARPNDFSVHLCASGQHRQLLAQALKDFCLEPDTFLDVMTEGQTLATLSSRLFSSIDTVLAKTAPDLVLVQGDTTTVQIAALCAFYRHIPIGHVEAGLRSGNLSSPFPEELNRRVAGLVASHHFAPTEAARQELLAEGVPDKSILVTGNTVIDALAWMVEQVRNERPTLPAELESLLEAQRDIVLVTGHRRENFGQPLVRICSALKRLAGNFPETAFVYPLHPNPNVRQAATDHLAGIPNILLTTPLPYKPFVRLMDSSRILLTDSGGLQEEGPALGKPVLVMREVTERPEGVEAGVNLLVGTDEAVIVSQVSRLLSNTAAYNSVARIANPYGDGHAAERIADFLAALPE